MKSIKSVVLLAAWVLEGFLTGVSTAYAQGVGSSGDIRGTVTDPSGRALPGASITVTDLLTGLRGGDLSDSTGQFRVTALPPATYDVAVSRSGFVTETHKNVVVAIGQTVISDFRLKLSQVEMKVDVSWEPQIVDSERASQANSVSQRYITGLPIDRRDYLEFTLLMPGVSNSNTIADNADFRVKQTPQSGLSFYGSNGRGNSVTVDGGEVNDDAGGVSLNVSQEVVKEFQINRSNYAAELGGASGASVNIVTKSGTNHVRGELYGFFRNDVMDARDPFAFSPALALDPTFSNFSLTAIGAPVKNTLSRQQFGGTISFPIRHDRTFLMAAYEGLYSEAEDTVPLLTNSNIFGPTGTQQSILNGLAQEEGAPVPCLTGRAPMPASTCAGVLGKLLTASPTNNPMNQFIVTQFEKDSGVFPFPIRQHQGSARLDQRFSNADQAFLRYNFSHQDESDPDVHALVGYSRGSSQLAWSSTLQGSWFHRFAGNSINEARLQWGWFQFNVSTNDRGGPGLDVQGFGFFGRNIFLPSFITQRHCEAADNLTLVRGRHTIKLGAYELLRIDHSTSDTFFSGRFEFLDLPGGVLSPCLQAPAVCGLAASTSPAPINSLQSWSLQAPAFYEQGFGNPVFVEQRPYSATFAQDAWRPLPNFTLNYGLRYEVDSEHAPLGTYTKNLAPRVSFAWDPFGHEKTVIRGGYGIFYSPTYEQIPNVVHTLGNVNGARQIANTMIPIQGLPTNPRVNSAAIFSTLFAQGKILCGTPPDGAAACVTPSDLTQFGVTVSNTGPLPPGTVLFSSQPNYRNPQSQQASFGVEQEIGSLSISANYIYVHTTHLPWAVDHNLLPGAPVVRGTGANGLPTNGLPLQSWAAPQCLSNPGSCFADPTRTVLQNNQYSSVAAAIYNGGYFEVKKRISDPFTLTASYTYSKVLDDTTDFNSDYAAFNEVDLRAERAQSDFDQRHKVALAAIVEIPHQYPRALRGFSLSSIIAYNSGHPFNLLAGADINGDGHFTNDRPPGAPRNSGLGPDYFNLDMRLSRRFKLGEKPTLLFTAEGFNLPNRINYATVNNIVGADFAPPFTAHGTARLSPSQPLGFTAALPRREVQLGAHLSF